MAKNILQSPSTNLTGVASPEFFQNEFDAAIVLKGYDVILERALKCPCHKDHPLIDCQNCFGTGYFYINPIKTKALITGINQTNQYRTWSETLLGTISITVRDQDKPNLSYFDRVILDNQFSYYSEDIQVRQNLTNSFVFATYKPEEIIAVYAFVSSHEPLLKLEKTDYSINPDNPYCILIEGGLEFDLTLSVYYRHKPEYHCLDLPHEIRSSWVKNKKTGQMELIQLPVQAVARRSHLIAMQKPNFDGTGIIDNENV